MCCGVVRPEIYNHLLADSVRAEVCGFGVCKFFLHFFRKLSVAVFAARKFRAARLPLRGKTVGFDGEWNGPPSSGAGTTLVASSLSAKVSGSGASRPASGKSLRRGCHGYESHIRMRLSDGWPSNVMPMRSNASRSCQSAPLKTPHREGSAGFRNPRTCTPAARIFSWSANKSGKPRQSGGCCQLPCLWPRCLARNCNQNCP